MIEKLYTYLLLLMLPCFSVEANNPIENRISSAKKSLPKGARIVVSYSDTRRHKLYFTVRDRLFSYDVITGKKCDETFATTKYSKIKECWLSPDSTYIFMAVDNGPFSSFYLDNGQTLWRLDTRTKRSRRIGEGFEIIHKKGCIVIRKASRCLNPKAQQSRQKWMGQDHYYDLNGKIIWAKDEYKIK